MLQRTSATVVTWAAASVEISSQTLGDVRILKALGAYGDVITPLSAAILRVLAEEPSAVVCDLSAIVWRSGPNGEEGHASLAQLGDCVRSWPGTPVLMACPDARVRAALQRQLRGIHVVFTNGMAAALEGALGGSRRVDRLQLWPEHGAPSTARAFTRRMWQHWQLPGDSGSALLVTSELVTNAVLHARTDHLELSLAVHDDRMRIAVRDRDTRTPASRLLSGDQLGGRGLLLVDALSVGWGVLPADDGKAVWAVLDIGRAVEKPPLLHNVLV
jgi:histidine kinase-like protein